MPLPEEVERRERALERQAVMRKQGLTLRIFRLRLQSLRGFPRPNARHYPSYRPTAASAAACRLATRSMEKFSIASLKSR